MLNGTKKAPCVQGWKSSRCQGYARGLGLCYARGYARSLPALKVVLKIVFYMLIPCLRCEEASELVSDVALFVQIVKGEEEEKVRESSARRPSARIGQILSLSLSLSLFLRGKVKIPG